MAEIIFYKYFEFFLAEKDLTSMFVQESPSYMTWLSTLQDNVDSCNQANQSITNRPIHNKTNPYCIKCTAEYNKIKEISSKILNDPSPNSKDVKEKMKEINKKYKNLRYYSEIYLYAHHHFDLMREQIGKKMIGGSNALEQFKEKIRRQIKAII